MNSVGVLKLAGGVIVLNNRRGTAGTSGAHEESGHAVSVAFTHPGGFGIGRIARTGVPDTLRN